VEDEEEEGNEQSSLFDVVSDMTGSPTSQIKGRFTLLAFIVKLYLHV